LGLKICRVPCRCNIAGDAGIPGVMASDHDPLLAYLDIPRAR
jgi:hypothetical protein